MCRQCGCVDNTACAGSYWYNRAYGKPLVCSECGSGTWHGRFAKRSAAGMLVDQDGHLWSTEESLPTNYKIMGEVCSCCYYSETGVQCSPSTNERETMPRDATIITLEQAIDLLPDGKYVHTFQNPAGGMVMGCDCERSVIEKALAKAEEIHVAGDVARSMFHGIAIINDESWLFIETAKTNEVLDFLANPKAEVANG
jgi:hypothetical protein